MKQMVDRLDRATARLGAWWCGVSVTSRLVLAAALLAAVILALVPLPIAAPPRARITLGLTLFTVALWATTALPQPVTGGLFLLIVSVAGLAGPSAVMSGFFSSALLLVFGGLLIGTAAERSGLGLYVASRLLGRFRGSYSGLVFGILLGTSLLTFLVPVNMGRLAITVPIAMAIAREAGYEPTSSGYVGLLVTTIIGNFTVAIAVLPGNLLNIMIVGAGEALYGVRVSYMKYLLLCGPVLGIAKAVIVWRVILWVYPAPPPRGATAGAPPAALSAEARRVAVILAGAIAMWVTDFLHAIPPGYVAAAAGVLCLVPKLGVLPPSEGIARQRLIILVWVASVLSLAAILAESGASRLVSGVIARVAAIEGGTPLYGHLAIAYTASILAALATFGGAVPITASAVGDIARATGLPIEVGILSIAPGMSALLFPYIAAPIMVGLMLGKVSVRDATRFTLATAVITWIVIIPLNALWWRALGVIG